jgi:hypothetical protein
MPQLPDVPEQQNSETPAPAPAPGEALAPAVNPVGPAQPAPPDAGVDQSSETTDPLGADQVQSIDNATQSLAPVEPKPLPDPNAPEVMGPPVDLAGDDLSTTYSEHRTNLSGSSADEELAAAFGGGAKAAADGGVVGAAKATAKATKSTALDMMVGAMESPTQIMGGIRDAVQNALNLPDDFAKQLITMLPGKEFDAAKAYVASPEGKASKSLPQMPEVSAPKSTTGGLVRGTAQFLTGFFAAGKAAEGVAATSTAAKVIDGMLKGSAASFTAFSGMDKRLSDWVEEHDSIKNPVTAYLASDPNDTAIEGRFKNALEGELPGALVQGVVAAAKLVKMGKVIESFDRLAKEANGETVAPREFKPEDMAVLGDPASDKLFINQKMTDAEAAVAGADPAMLGSTAPTKGINWARINAPEDVQTVMKQMANTHSKSLEQGVQSHAQTVLSASQEDAFTQLMSRRQGETLNASQTVAARDLWGQSAGKLKEVASLAAAAPTEANLFAFRKQMATHFAIQKEVMAARTETARALNAWKIPAGDGKIVASQMAQLLQDSGGGEMARAMAEKVAQLGAAGLDSGIEKMVNGGVLARTKDALAQIWINSLLSNPTTHVANTVSNFAAAFQQVGERRAAEYLSQKFGTEGGVEIGEAFAMAHGMMSAFTDSLQAVTKRVKTEGVVGGAEKALKETSVAPLDVASKVETQGRPSGLSAERWNVSSDSTLGRAMDTIDVAVNTPGRLLQGSDNFFKSLGYRMELHAQATRMATKELRGGTIGPGELKQRIAEIIENPPSDVHIEAVNAATYQTFTSKPAEALKKVGDAIQNLPGGRLLLPFKNTPINIFTYAFERTPLAPMVQTWRADVMAGGARRDVALARMSTGTMILQMGMDQAISGRISGKGPEEPGQRAAWLRSGHQPYSLKVGDTWVGFNRLDPLGFHLGLAADIAEACVNAQGDIETKDFEHAMVAAAFSISNNVLSKTYMEGTAQFMAALTNPDRNSDRYVSRLAGSILPAGGANIARQMDPYMRTADGIVDSLKRRIPGLSSDLPLYRDLWGRPVDYRSPGGWAYDMFSPAYLKKESAEPVDKEIQKLEYYPDMPARKISQNGVTIQLDPKQFSRYVQLAGNEAKDPAFNMGAKDYLNAVIEGKHPMSAVYQLYSDGPDGGKAQFIRGTLNKYKDLAKKQLLEEDGGLRATAKLKKDSSPGRFQPSLMGK